MIEKKVIDIPEPYRPKIEDLPGELSRIAAVIEQHRPGQGVELTLFMAQVFRGQNLYFRNIDYLIRQIRDDAIRRGYDQGAKVKDLALRWHLSKRWVEEILARTGKEAADAQLSLF